MVNVLRKNKVLFVFLIIAFIVSLIHIILATYSERGLMYDGIVWFMDCLSISENDWLEHYVNFTFSRYRATVRFLNELPTLIAANWFGITDKHILGFIYSFPLFFYSFIITVYNCILAETRTKRYDFVVCPLILYCIFILPCMMYSIVELYLAVSVYSLIFHYVCAKIDYKIYDIIIILVSLFIAFASTEAVLYLFPILLFCAVKYSKNETTYNKTVKYIIAIITLISFCCCIYFTFLIPHGNDYISSFRFWDEFNVIRSNFWHVYYTYVDILFSLLLAGCFIIRKKFNIYFWIVLTAILIIFLRSIIISGEYSSLYFFSRRFYLYPVIFVLTILSLGDKLSEFLQRNKIVLNNIIILIIMFGIFNTSIQIACSYSFEEATNELTSILMQGKYKRLSPYTSIKYFYQDEFNKAAFNCDTYLYDSIIFNTYRPKSIIYDKRNPNCPDIYIYPKKKVICTDFSCFSIKNKYWDLTNVTTEFEKDKSNIDEPIPLSVNE